MMFLPPSLWALAAYHATWAATGALGSLVRFLRLVVGS
jgi:hypothetical protein